MDKPDALYSKQVGVRLPGHLYRWLKEKVEASEYSNMAQSVIGELTKAKALEERRREERSWPSGAYEVHEDQESDPLVSMLNRRLEAVRRELLEEMEKRRGGRP